MMTDSVVSVKDTTAWALGRICEMVLIGFDDTTLGMLVQTLSLNGLADHPRVAANSAWVRDGMICGVRL